MDYRNKSQSIFFPLLLVAVGVFLLLNTLKIIEGSPWELLVRLWPLILILGGLDGLYRRDGFVGPVIFIGLGTIFLLDNLGYLAVGTRGLLLRLWPVFLIAWGIDLLIGRRSAWITVLGTLLGVALIAAIVWFAIAGAGSVTRAAPQPLAQELGNVKRASLNIEAPMGMLEISAGAQSDNLIEGELYLGRNEQISQEYHIQQGRGVFNLTSEDLVYFLPFLNAGSELNWRLKLSDAVPLELSSKVIFGEQRVDLSGLVTERITTETVIGRNTTLLPEEGEISGSVGVAIGEVVILLPPNADVRIEADTGIASVSIPEGYLRSGDLILSPRADAADTQIDLTVNVPIGNLRVEILP